MSEHELERAVAADMPVNDEDAAAIVGGAIVKTYTLPDTTVTVDRRTSTYGPCILIFRIGTTFVSETQAKAKVEKAGQRWIPSSEFSDGYDGFLTNIR